MLLQGGNNSTFKKIGAKETFPVVQSEPDSGLWTSSTLESKMCVGRTPTEKKIKTVKRSKTSWFSFSWHVSVLERMFYFLSGKPWRRSDSITESEMLQCSCATAEKIRRTATVVMKLLVQSCAHVAFVAFSSLSFWALEEFIRGDPDINCLLTFIYSWFENLTPPPDLPVGCSPVKRQDFLPVTGALAAEAQASPLRRQHCLVPSRQQTEVRRVWQLLANKSDLSPCGHVTKRLRGF